MRADDATRRNEGAKEVLRMGLPAKPELAMVRKRKAMLRAGRILVRSSLLFPLFLIFALASTAVVPALAEEASADAPVDVALVVSVDVSGSVDEGRYGLQMNGIAKALEDPRVIASMLSGPRASILFSMVEWSEKATVAIAWTRIASREDALAVAARVRKTSRPEGEFTCVAHMMSFVAEVVAPAIPVKAQRVVMDVSGDGVDNCDGDETTSAMRDQLVLAGVTINGLPINEGDPAEPVGGGAYRAPGRPFQQRRIPAQTATLEPWYRDHVMGGPNAFLMPAQGYRDFDRAILEKFAIEVSAAPSPRSHFAALNAAARR
jgi:hypothetical protein